jgi:hypothetical protein
MLVVGDVDDLVDGRGASIGDPTRLQCSRISAAVTSATTGSISLSRSVAGKLAAFRRGLLEPVRNLI